MRSRSAIGALALVACAFAFLAPRCGVHAAVQPTPAPAESATPLPYPAYGPPAPGVVERSSVPGIAARVSLSKAVAIAVARSPVFASERAVYQLARAKYGAAKSAVLPNVSITAGSDKTYGPSFFGTQIVNGTFTNDQIRAQLQQLIFDGGRAIAGIESAKAADLAGYDTLQRQLQTLAFGVASAYYQALQAEQTVRLDARIVAEYEAQERLVRAKIAVGKAAPSDLAQAQFQTAQARLRLVQAQGAQIAAESSFATTLGLDANAGVAPLNDTPLDLDLATAPAPPSYATALRRALLLRPDYLAAVANVRAAQENLRYAKLARVPQIVATASTGRSNELPFSPVLRRTDTLGATLTIPIFDQGLTNYNVAVAASQMDQAVASLRSARLSVESDVRGALANLVSARAAVDQARYELHNAQISFDAARAKYAVGAATLLDLIQQEVNLSQAQTDALNTLYAYRLAQQQYRYAVGEMTVGS